ncbi:MAG: hypothetical protein ACYTF0_01890 [Planctomycetota bacterium]|jgi:hypothetical protein
MPRFALIALAMTSLGAAEPIPFITAHADDLRHTSERYHQSPYATLLASEWGQHLWQQAAAQPQVAQALAIYHSLSSASATFAPRRFGIDLSPSETDALALAEESRPAKQIHAWLTVSDPAPLSAWFDEHLNADGDHWHGPQISVSRHDDTFVLCPKEATTSPQRPQGETEADLNLVLDYGAFFRQMPASAELDATSTPISPPAGATSSFNTRTNWNSIALCSPACPAMLCGQSLGRAHPNS